MERDKSSKTSISYQIDKNAIIQINLKPEDELVAHKALKTLSEIGYIGDFNTRYNQEEQDNPYYNEFYQNINTQELDKIHSFINQSGASEKKKLIWKMLFSPLTGEKAEGIIEESIWHFYGLHTKSEEDQRWFLNSIASISGISEYKKSNENPQALKNASDEYIKLMNNFHLEKALKNSEVNEAAAKTYFYKAQKYIAQFFIQELQRGTKNAMRLILPLYQSFNNYIYTYEEIPLRADLETKLIDLKQCLDGTPEKSDGEEVKEIRTESRSNIIHLRTTK